MDPALHRGTAPRAAAHRSSMRCSHSSSTPVCQLRSVGSHVAPAPQHVHGQDAASMCAARPWSAQTSAPAARSSHQRRRSMVCRASSSSGGAKQRKELPIFPLNVVALPTVSIPLMIFEPRYRVLFNTLLEGAEGIEEGLVQKESPFAGSRCFGMCLVTQRGELAGIGTALKIQEFVRQDDGRMFVIQQGVERFQITRVVKEKPVLICEVEVLPEDDAQDEETTALAKEVADLFRNTLRLQFKVKRQRDEKRGKAAASSLPDNEEELLEPEKLAKLSPLELSYWIAHSFSEFKVEQQALLEEDSTSKRLQREKQILSETLKFFSAATALEGVFSSGSTEGGSSEQQPPPGGPD